MECTGQKCSAQLRSDNKTGLCRDCYLADYRKRNREMLNEKMRKKRYANAKWQLVASAKARSKKTDLECTVTEDDIWIPETCPLIGIEMSVIQGSGKINAGSPTLDRFDSSKGYTPDNVWVISHLANRMKSSATSDQLDQFAKSWLQMRGMEVIDQLHDVNCPGCSYEGPHTRLGVSMDGNHVVVRCGHGLCLLEWRVTGPEKQANN